MPAKFDHPQPILGYQGAALADSATGDPKTHQWDVPQGKLISKPLRITRRYIRFLESPAGKVYQSSIVEGLDLALTQAVGRWGNEVGEILVRPVDHPIFTEPGANPRRDRVEVADDDHRSQPDSAEAVGATVRGE